MPAKTKPASSKAKPVEKTAVPIAAAKGRPMLTWVGKRPLRQVTAFPAQHIETFNPTGEPADKAGLLFHGDNKEVLAWLLANGYRGKVNLIYIDPPFDSGADYVRKVELRGIKGTGKLEGEGYTLGEQIQYTDIWANDNYLQFMYERLLLLKELLCGTGSLFLHVDWHRNHVLKSVCDEVFGPENFCDEIIWCYGSPSGGRAGGTKFVKNHETILHYCRDLNSRTENRIYLRYSKRYIEDWFKWTDDDGRRYRKRLRGREKNGDLIWEKQYLDESKGLPCPTVWTDIQQVYADPRAYKGNTKSELDFEYPTQKPEALIERFVLAASNPNDLVLDCFLGSGTTAAVAQKLGRRWIGCDINKGAIQTTCKRLQTIITEQIEAMKKGAPILPGMDADKAPKPAQLSFSVYRVNDYDLQIQHNEAVNLACEHIGVTRTRTDAFFDGTLGKRLVKIIPFGHPLTVLDLEELKRELAARPDEERDVVVVCLGKELAVEAWLEEWNRLRKKGDVPNKIEVVELRTDPKYGKFIAHQPARAKVSIRRVKDKLVIEIEDFISPAIIERLSQQEGVLKPKITDWRAMVDSVMIDPAYDGKVFNIALSDVPEKKSDLVTGKYELPAPKVKTTVAVKITDMLGEEVLQPKTV
jgi:DNA modification methylase